MNPNPNCPDSGYRPISRNGNGGFELRDRDKRILELNQQGLSCRRISEVLKDEGMNLGKTGVTERLKELRMDPENYVRANNHVSRTKDARKYGRWYKIMEWLKNHTAQYEIRNGFKISIRTGFYDAMDAGLVKDTEYNVFTQRAADARIGYVDQDGELLLPKIPIDAFSDTSRKVVDRYDATSPIKMQEPGYVPDSIEHIEEAISLLMEAPADYEGKGSDGTKGRVGGIRFGQPEYVEVWQEKTDLTDAFTVLLAGTHIKLRSNKGYSSVTFLQESIEDLIAIIEGRGLEPQDVTILYCGDWDPSGEYIDYYIQMRLRQLGLTGINFIRIAVTPEQIDKYHLPKLPVEKKPDKKRPNPIMDEFIRRHGKKASHLNAFFAEAHLPTFKKILIDAINEHWYQEIYDVMKEVYEVYPPDPPELEEEELKKRRRNQYRRITQTFSDPSWCRNLPDAPDPDDIDEMEEEDDDAIIYDDYDDDDENE